MLAAALDRRRSILGPDNAEIAESLVARGALRSDQAQYDEAERLTREGLSMIKRHAPAGHPSIAKATFALGRVLEDRGRYNDAIEVLDEAVRLQSSPGAAPSDLAASLYELANVHFYAGHYDVCESLNRRALALHRQLYGDRHPSIADDLINLGAIQYELGRYSDAERLYRQGLEITRAWYGKDHFKTAADMTMLGRTLNKELRFAEALDMMQEALAIRERVYGKNHPSVASAVNELGTIALGQGHFDDAEGYFRRMLEIYRQVYGKDGHYLIGTALSNLASVYAARNEHERAESLFREAISVYVRKLSPDHLNTGIARIKLGRSLLRQYRYTEAETESAGGYDILRQQMNPTVTWLQNARQDLVAEYEALGDRDKSQKFRAELAAK